jgi:hypothetical protein
MGTEGLRGAIQKGSEPADVLSAVMAIDNELVEWILHAAPKTDDEKREMKEILRLRTQLERHLNQLVLEKMKLATLGLTEQCGRLGVITVQIRATAKTITTVKEVLTVAGETVTIAAQVVAQL